MARTKQHEPEVLHPDEAPVAQLPAAPAKKPPTLYATPDMAPAEWPTNYDLATVEGRAGLINAGRPAEWQPQDGGTYELLATHFVCYPDVTTDQETGEEKEISRVCLIDKDGVMVKFASDFMHRKLHALWLMFSPEEWARGVRIECYTAKSRRPGRSPYGGFRVLGLGPPPAAPDNGTGE